MILKEVENDQVQSNTGWICPRCQNTVSPAIKSCPDCQNEKVNEVKEQGKQILMETF